MPRMPTKENPLSEFSYAEFVVFFGQPEPDSKEGDTILVGYLTPSRFTSKVIHAE